jgi:hypothetical protein
MSSEASRALVTKYVVFDVPDEMTACFDCDAVRCTDDKYETCPERLFSAATLTTTRTSERLSANCAAAAR